jgi:hypothetical protein
VYIRKKGGDIAMELKKILLLSNLLIRKIGIHLFVFVIFVAGLVSPFFLCLLGKVFEISFFSLFSKSVSFSLMCSFRNFVLSFHPVMGVVLSFAFGGFIFFFALWLLEILFPNLIWRKIVNMLYDEYVIQKLKGNVDAAKRYSKKISEVQFMISRTRM